MTKYFTMKDFVITFHKLSEKYKDKRMSLVISTYERDGYIIVNAGINYDKDYCWISASHGIEKTYDAMICDLEERTWENAYRKRSDSPYSFMLT